MKDLLSKHPNLALKPGLTPEQLTQLQQASGREIPQWLKNLLLDTSGFSIVTRSGVLEVQFSEFLNEFQGIFPYGCYLLAHNGEGDFWYADIKESGEWGAIFHIAHDPPVFILQFDTIRAFIEQAATNTDLVEQTRDVAAEIWRRRVAGLPVAEALRSDDPMIVAFAQTLPSNYNIHDLRNQLGNGFAWGRGAADAELKRYGSELLFGLEVKQSKISAFLERAFGWSKGSNR